MRGRRGAALGIHRVAAELTTQLLGDPMGTMMQWLCPQEIELDLDVAGRWEALRAVSAIIERSQRLAAAPVFRALWRREMAASTGVGNGFAIPHARIPGITEPVTVYVRLKAPVDFAAPDARKVSELFVILVPDDDANERNLLLLALVAEAFSDRDFRTCLAAAAGAQDARSAFAQWVDGKHFGEIEVAAYRERATRQAHTGNSARA
jgi:nitrogen PTS system EIIA component